MDIFVKKSKRVTVEVYAWDKDGDIESSSDKQDVPKDVDEVKIVRFTFRHPGYADSNKIASAARFVPRGDEEISGDLVNFQDSALRTLLEEIETDGEVIPARPREINALHPSLARSAVAGLLEVVSI